MSNDATGKDPFANQTINSSELVGNKSCPSLLDTAARLKLIRDVVGFSQRELAKRAGVTNSSISMIEQGQVSPSVQSLTRILSAFPISLADFFNFKAPCDTANNPARKTDAQILSGAPLRQLDAQTEDVLAGQSTACTVLAVDSCGLVFEGEIQLTLLSGNRLLAPGDSFYIPAGQLFRLINISARDARIFRCSIFIHRG